MLVSLTYSKHHNSKTLFGRKSIACINSTNLWSKPHSRLSFVCVCTRLSIASIHFHLSLLSLPFSSGLLKNSAHNLSIFGGDTFSFMGGILILGQIPGSKKKKVTYLYEEKTVHMYADDFPPGFFPNFGLCVRSFPIRPVRCNFIPR